MLNAHIRAKSAAEYAFATIRLKMNRKLQYSNHLKPIRVEATLNTLVGGKTLGSERKSKKQAFYETWDVDVENKGMCHRANVANKQKKLTYTYKRRKWDSHSHCDLDASRSKIKDLLQEQKIYLENIKKAKTKLKQAEDEELLRKQKRIERKVRMEKRREKQKTYESSMYTNKKYEIKYGERRTYQGNFVAENADVNDNRRRCRQQSLPSIPSPKTCKARKRIQTFASSKSSTDLQLSRCYDKRKNKRSSHGSEDKTMRRAKLIKDLEEAQKWNNFISRQIKPLERTIDYNREQLQNSWLTLLKIAYFCSWQNTKLICSKRRKRAAKQIQVWWKYIRKQHFVKSMTRCVNILRRQRGRFKLGIRCWQRAKCACIVREFVVDTSRSRFAIAMKRLRWNVVQAQRAAKAFLECKKARIHSLFRVWIRCERRNRSKLLELQKEQNNKTSGGNNLEHIVEEKKRYQKLRAIAFTNDTPETRWKKTLRDPNGSVIDPAEANEIGKLIAARKRNETLFESLARVAQHVNVKRHETLNPQIVQLHEEHAQMIATATSNTSNAPSVDHYINYKSIRGKSKKRHVKFQQLRPWAKKCIEEFSVPFVDPQFVPDYRRFIFLEQLLENQRRTFSTRVYTNATTVNVDDVKRLMWNGGNFESLVEKKKIQVPILRLYTGTEIFANKCFLLEQIKKEMING